MRFGVFGNLVFSAFMWKWTPNTTQTGVVCVSFRPYVQAYSGRPHQSFIAPIESSRGAESIDRGRFQFWLFNFRFLKKSFLSFPKSTENHRSAHYRTVLSTFRGQQSLTNRPKITEMHIIERFWALFEVINRSQIDRKSPKCTL